VRSGYIQLGFTGTSFNTAPGTYDITTNFSPLIGSWTVTSSTVLTLVFANTTTTLVPPNFTGIVNWFDGSGNVYRGSMISPSGVNNTTLVTLTSSPAATAAGPYTWTMTFRFQSKSFITPTTQSSTNVITPTNNGLYGFILQMSMVL
jgi:hypothetical protein